MSTEQKLREALQAVIAAHDACMRELGEQMRAANITNFRVDGQAVIDSFAAIEQARQALATTEPVMANGLTEAETDACASVVGLATTAPAVNQQLTTEPFDEREAFEREMSCEEIWGHRSFKKKPDGRYANWCVDLMWDVWQARAARAQGVKGVKG